MKLRLVTASVVAAVLLAPVVGSPASANHPETIDLPAGFAGEGVATGRPGTFYAGSRTDGRIARGDLRAGTSEVFVAEPLVSAATGLKADLRHDLLWVSGAATGQGSGLRPRHRRRRRRRSSSRPRRRSSTTWS